MTMEPPGSEALICCRGAGGGDTISSGTGFSTAHGERTSSTMASFRA
jgi:hypothetical protein